MVRSRAKACGDGGIEQVDIVDPSRPEDAVWSGGRSRDGPARRDGAVVGPTRRGLPRSRTRRPDGDAPRPAAAGPRRGARRRDRWGGPRFDPSMLRRPGRLRVAGQDVPLAEWEAEPARCPDVGLAAALAGGLATAVVAGQPVAGRPPAGARPSAEPPDPASDGPAALSGQAVSRSATAARISSSIGVPWSAAARRWRTRPGRRPGRWRRRRGTPRRRRDGDGLVADAVDGVGPRCRAGTSAARRRRPWRTPRPRRRRRTEDRLGVKMTASSPVPGGGPGTASSSQVASRVTSSHRSVSKQPSPRRVVGRRTRRRRPTGRGGGRSAGCRWA